MKTEEAKRIAMGLRTDFKCESDTMVDFCNTIIKALEQESILDKIRAEIADLDDADYGYEGYYNAVTDVLQIIDKYKSESEDKE